MQINNLHMFLHQNINPEIDTTTNACPDINQLEEI